MTDRIRYLTVMLDADYRDAETEELDQIVAAIERVRGVKHVAKGKPVNIDNHLAETMVRLEMSKRLHEIAAGISSGDVA